MTKKDYKDFDYIAKTAELEQILAQLQSSETSLDAAIKLHATGKKLIVELEEYLKEAELTVKHQTAGE